MELQNNGAVEKNGTAKEITNNAAQNGTAKKELASSAKSQPANGKAETSEVAKPETAKPQQVAQKVEEPTNKPVLSLEAKLKMVNDLHRRSVQRLNLISRISQLEAFEIMLSQENDELEDNPYQGCKLIIRDDKNREFLTTTPGLIRLVAQYIFTACNDKLTEIEATINFPTV